MKLNFNIKKTKAYFQFRIHLLAMSEIKKHLISMNLEHVKLVPVETVITTGSFLASIKLVNFYILSWRKRHPAFLVILWHLPLKSDNPPKYDA